MNLLIAFVTGLMFGAGLILSGMSDPGKVLGFLDLAGHWDPSLAFVMLGAIAVATPAFAVARRRGRTLGGAPLTLPTSQAIDRRLVGGSLLFGIGWGLAGICPGPAFVLLGMGLAKGAVFVIAMLAGMAVFSWRQRRSR
ncbi:DUF6691 family protein [Uliginosibacterium sp. sgz301328]|uniref:DUF6691 family protein n=1 Tax=Uliginosibacterium sp. sgz301328 TaxID=3243764 RepID=UPI00359EC4D9